MAFVPVVIGVAPSQYELFRFVWSAASGTTFASDEFAVDAPVSSLTGILPLDQLLRLAAVHEIVVSECHRSIVDVSMLLELVHMPGTISGCSWGL